MAAAARRTLFLVMSMVAGRSRDATQKAPPSSTASEKVAKESWKARQTSMALLATRIFQRRGTYRVGLLASLRANFQSMWAVRRAFSGYSRD